MHRASNQTLKGGYCLQACDRNLFRKQEVVVFCHVLDPKRKIFEKISDFFFYVYTSNIFTQRTKHSKIFDCRAKCFINRCRLNCILAGKKLKNLQKTVKTYSVEIDGPWVGIIL